MTNINRGFEVMIPKRIEKSKPLFYNRIRFKMFSKTFSFTIEVTKDDHSRSRIS